MKNHTLPYLLNFNAIPFQQFYVAITNDGWYRDCNKLVAIEERFNYFDGKVDPKILKLIHPYHLATAMKMCKLNDENDFVEQLINFLVMEKPNMVVEIYEYFFIKENNEFLKKRK